MATAKELKKAPSKKLERWEVDEQGLKDGALAVLQAYHDHGEAEAQRVVAENTAENLNVTKADRVINWLLDVWQAKIQGIVTNTKPFFVEHGYPDTKDMSEKEKSEIACSLISISRYFRHVETFMDLGWRREYLEGVSLRTLCAASAYAKENLLKSGNPAKSYVTAMQDLPTEAFKKEIRDGKHGPPKRPPSGKNPKGDAIPTNGKVQKAIESQSDNEILLGWREAINAQMRHNAKMLKSKTGS